MSEKIKHESVTELTTSHLREMILSGELKSGERLTEQRLTEKLGISRQALRDSFRNLAKESLIVIEPRKGTSVATFDSHDIEEILSLRSALERIAIEFAIPLKDESRIRDCENALADMERAAKSENRSMLVREALKFHTAIVALSGNLRLVRTYTSLNHELIMCMTHNLYAREQHNETLTAHIHRHKDLLDVIKKGDKKEIMDELTHHGENIFLLQDKGIHQAKVVK